MPKQLTEIKQFIEFARLKDARAVRIKKNATGTKLKLRRSKYLYTLIIEDDEKADKLKQSLPPGLTIEDVSPVKPAKRK